MSPLSKITNRENTSQFKLLKDSSSNTVIDLLKHNTIPNTFFNNFLTSRDTDKELDMKGDFLKTITIENNNVDLASLQDKKLMFDFAKEMNIDLQAQGNKSTRDRTLIKSLKSPGLMISASGFSKTNFVPSDPNELCDRFKLLTQEKQAGNKSDIINQKIVATVDQLLEHKCISKKQHKQLLNKIN